MPDTMIDIEARERIAKLWTFVREVASALWGDDERRDNGIRSMVKDQEARLLAMESDQRTLRGDLQHYLDKGREETCLGLKALADHEAACEDLYLEGEKEETEVAVAHINAEAGTKAAQWQFLTGTVVQLLILAGIVFLALKGIK